MFSGAARSASQIHPEIADDGALVRGAEVVLNESLQHRAGALGRWHGEVVSLKEVLDDGRRALIVGRADEERVVELTDDLVGTKLRSGDSLLLDSRAGAAREAAPARGRGARARRGARHLATRTSAASTTRSSRSPTPSSCRSCTRSCSPSTSCRRPRGSCSTGPPGCGKTLIAKAVANSLAKKVAPTSPASEARSYFINIKGPELLNKYVGETERQIRLVFQRAREKSEEGWPVIVFFDEMDSMFRTRGTGISSDMESTIVPQLLAEIDGVESLKNVIVIGASNREDLIDPAILRPGRLDVKIKIERPNETSAAQIFARYLTTDLPLDAGEVDSLGGGDVDKCVQGMIETTVDEMYPTEDRNRFLEVTYQNGDKELMYFKDFSSGAMIENIVRRAKKLAIKRLLGGESNAASASPICWRRSSRSSRSTRTCPTPPTPTTGPRSRARRASASSTCAR